MLIEGDYVCLYDADGRITGHFGIQRNISERARQEEALRESEEKFAKAFRSSPLPMSIATLEEGRFIEVNEAFLRDVGLPREEVIGRRAHDLGLWREPAAREELVHRLQSDGMVRRYEFEARTRLRERQINQIWAEKINLGGQDCLLDIVWDVTDAKANEEAMRRSRQELRDLAARLQTVREEERTRIARELHDELGQALTGLKMDLSWVRGRLPRTQSDLSDRLLNSIPDWTARWTRSVALLPSSVPVCSTCLAWWRRSSGSRRNSSGAPGSRPTSTCNRMTARWMTCEPPRSSGSCRRRSRMWPGTPARRWSASACCRPGMSCAWW
jgi:PAS domain S-box